MTLKEQLLQVCVKRVEKRISDYKEEINLLKEALEEADKSSDEDDDSGNGKLFNDLEKNMSYLNDAFKTKDYLKLVKTNINFTEAVLGSIVKTDSITFYIAISLGKIECEHQEFYAISLSSPVGQLLRNKKVNDTFEFNQTKYVIQEIK
ncbi:hypothetical protein PK35_07815 [Tamlana nanhaiensis]|uniref:Transcription elongation factor n=1 Tax=Neotamlana nanhaiensis TaxID=1382798 RepID=A0A0D7W1C0_9FLAO|nr:hypothetical protein [Tamlana nanhaiensis]KJD32876.1 hypothetical protein PK35_07815 [Tamlana nanhaiensis]